MARIDRVDARARLEPRRSPYWANLERGRQVGFRLMVKGSRGTWLARAYDGETYKQQPLGDFGSLAERERFDAAKRAAEEWFRHLDAGGSTTKGRTVRVVCEEYVEHLRQEKGDGPADDAKKRFERLVNDDAIGAVPLEKLAPRHVAEWKRRTLVRGSRSGWNRNATALRAALNLSKRRREVTSDAAWAEELRPFAGADGRRELYLSAADRRKLLAEASDEVRPFLQALALIPLRPGELAALKVDDLDLRHKVLRVPGGKTGRREVPLGDSAFAHLKACAQGQHPAAWLVRRASGDQWKKEAWRDEVKLAAKGAKLPAATVAYTLRHSVITDLVKGGLDLFHVAKLAGTSVSMIEKNYGQLQKEHARAALEQLARA